MAVEAMEEEVKVPCQVHPSPLVMIMSIIMQRSQKIHHPNYPYAKILSAYIATRKRTTIIDNSMEGTRQCQQQQKGDRMVKGVGVGRGVRV